MDANEVKALLMTATGVEGGFEMASASSDQIYRQERLDLESYAALYRGRTKTIRLMFIADCCNKSDQTMELEALRMAFDEIKKHEDTPLIKAIGNRIKGRLGPEYEFDSAWCETVSRLAEKRKRKLEDNLIAYKSSLIRESIRNGYQELGDFFYTHGLLAEALKSYQSCRDYCTSTKHIFDMCMNVILVSVDMDKFALVLNYVREAEGTPEAANPVVVAKLGCASALALLKNGNYKHAARQFLEVSPELGNSYNEVIAPQDVAVYGGLCALASFDRAELKTKLLKNNGFRNLLDLVPAVRELINGFYASRYASCLEYLGNLKENLLLDVHLRDHVEKLYNRIQEKALIQYTLPFVSLDLRFMANAFKTNVGDLEKELEALITHDLIQARIDSHNKILYARHADRRNATFKRVLEIGKDFNRDVRGMMLRANLLKFEFHAINSGSNNSPFPRSI